MVVVGACTGSDAHTVGIDAILNMKGYAGDKGLEAYPWIDAYNLGAQVDNAGAPGARQGSSAPTRCWSRRSSPSATCTRTTRARAHRAGAEARACATLLFLLGGPRIDHKLARELGFDAGFGPGTRPSQVAAFVVDRLTARVDGRAPRRGAIRAERGGMSPHAVRKIQ